MTALEARPMICETKFEIQTELGAERRQKEQQCNEEQHAIGLHPRKRDG